MVACSRFPNAALRCAAILLSLLVPVALPIQAAAQSHGTDICSQRVPSTRAWKRSVAHEILALESVHWPAAASARSMLDSIVRVASKRIGRLPAALASKDVAHRNAAALRVLRTIDTVLAKAGFTSPTMETEDLFHPSLRPATLHPDTVKRYAAHKHNARRTAIRGGRTGPIYLADCDATTLVYLAVAAQAKLPLAMFEVTDRQFLAWTFRDGTFIVYDPRYAMEMKPEVVILEYDVAMPHVERGIFMRPLSSREVRATALRRSASLWSARGCGGRAASDLAAAIALAPRNIGAKNELAWLMATDASVTDARHAFRLIDSAIAGFGPEDGWSRLPDRSRDWLARYLDTRAALRSNFQMFGGALEDELRALSLAPAGNVNECLYRGLVAHYQAHGAFRDFVDTCAATREPVIQVARNR